MTPNDRTDGVPDVFCLTTGIDELNRILSGGDSDSTGFLVRKGRGQDEWEMPIVLINGATGTGKTTLALQIAFSAAGITAGAGAATPSTRWLPFFYALEQTPLSLNNMALEFGCFEYASRPAAEQPCLCDLADPETEIQTLDQKPRIYLCHLSPRPITRADNQDVFERRFDELSHMVEKAVEAADNRFLVVFFIDSINAFSLAPLGRNEIHRLFSLFRSRRVLAVVTMEHHQQNLGSAEYESLECAKFLSDITITLEKDSSSGYLQHYLEIEKSRVAHQVLGKHLYKIRTHRDAESISLDPRTGIVLYPSIHSVLSRAIAQRGKEKQTPPGFVVCKEDDDLHNVILRERVQAGECLAVIGPRGSHKLALGINLATGHSGEPQGAASPTRLLIVNFGGSGHFEFSGVAWTQDRARFAQFGALEQSGTGDRNMKLWLTKYGPAQLQQNRAAEQENDTASMLTFRIGQLAPEECFHIIDKTIENARQDKVPFSSVLLSDIAELHGGFPLLASDPLFLPALIDLFTTRGLVSVCIGVDADQPVANANLNFALLSRADYRIVLSHYPKKDELYERIIRKAQGERLETLEEQLVALVIDNVSGKHYGRQPRWLSVEEDPKNERKKILHCDLEPPPKIVKRAQRAANGSVPAAGGGIVETPAETAARPAPEQPPNTA